MLGRAEIGAVETGVHVEYPDQGHAREVMALGQHLGAQQYPHFALPHPLQYPLQAAAAAGAVAVDPCRAHVREQPL